MAGIAATMAVVAAGETKHAGRATKVEFCVGPNLFIDDYLIAESRRLTRTTHQLAKRLESVIDHDRPGPYMTGVYDDALKRYRMWYQACAPSVPADRQSRVPPRTALDPVENPVFHTVAVAFSGGVAMMDRQGTRTIAIIGKT